MVHGAKTLKTTALATVLKVKLVKDTKLMQNNEWNSYETSPGH